MHLVAAGVKRFGNAFDVTPLACLVAPLISHRHGDPVLDDLALQLQQLELIFLQKLFVFLF